MTSLITKWTYALLVAAFLLICASAYVLFSQAAVLNDLRTEIAESRLDLARRQAQLMPLDEAINTTNEFLAGFEDLGAACDNVPASEPRVVNFCNLFRAKSGSQASFVGQFITVAALRPNSRSTGDFAGLRAKYQQLLALAGQFHAGERWQARIHEGMAYSDYRLGNLALAEQEIQAARRLDASSALVFLTDLKISCARRQAADAARRRYDEQLAALQAAAPRDNLAREGIGRLELDREVRLVCPGLPPVQPGVLDRPERVSSSARSPAAGRR